MINVSLYMIREMIVHTLFAPALASHLPIDLFRRQFIQQRLVVAVPSDVLGKDVVDTFLEVRTLSRPGDVRSEDHVRQMPQRVFGRKRVGIVHIDRSPADPLLTQTADQAPTPRPTPPVPDCAGQLTASATSDRTRSRFQL